MNTSEPGDRYCKEVPRIETWEDQTRVQLEAERQTVRRLAMLWTCKYSIDKTALAIIFFVVFTVKSSYFEV